MKKLDARKLYTQYRGIIKPCEPVISRKYTITHSDSTVELFVFIAENYAEYQINKMRYEVRIAWQQTEKGLALIGLVLIDARGVIGNSHIRNQIFYKEIFTVLQAIRHADRFLFDKEQNLDNTPIYIIYLN